MKHIDPYLTAEALNLEEGQRQDLIELTKMLFNEEVDLDMVNWSSCICGQLNQLSPESWNPSRFIGHKVRDLFVPGVIIFDKFSMHDITQKMAGKACFNYLTTGDADWTSAISEK